MNTNNKDLLLAAETAVASIDHSHVAIYCNGVGIRKLYTEKLASFAVTLGNHPNPDIFNLSNSLVHINGVLRTDWFNEISMLKAALELVEENKDFKAACAILDPLLAKVAELRERVLEGERKYNSALNAITAAEEVALAKAKAALESNPTVAKLREAAEEARPAYIEAPVFRGRVNLNQSAD